MVNFSIDKAIRTRGCHICKGEIEPGEYHIKFNSDSFFSKNLCQRCMKKFLDKLMKKNGTSFLEVRMEESLQREEMRIFGA